MAIEYKIRADGSWVAENIKEREEPKKTFGPLEIENEEKRGIARKALGELWEAMSLYESCSGLRSLSLEKRELYYNLFQLIGNTLLGECPEFEQLT